MTTMKTGKILLLYQKHRSRLTCTRIIGAKCGYLPPLPMSKQLNPEIKLIEYRCRYQNHILDIFFF